MSIINFVQNLFHTVGHAPTRIAIKQDHYIDNAITAEQKAALIGQAAVSGQHYVRVWVSRMMLGNDTSWFQQLYPAVYSVTTLGYGDQYQDLTNLAGPKQLGDLKPTSLNRSLRLDTTMTGLLPFRGGTLQLNCGLAQMPGNNIIGNFLDTIGEFARQLAQPQVSTGIAIAGKIALGVQSLMGVSKATLKLYYQQTFTGLAGPQALKSGFIFLSDKKSGDIEDEQLWVIGGEPRIGATASASEVIQGQNYLLLRIEVSADRDDWDQIRAIEGPLQKALDAKISGKPDDARGFLVAAKIAAYDSQDLTTTDRIRVIREIDKAYSAVPLGLAVDAFAAAPAVSLGALMANAAPLAAGMHLKLPPLSEILAGA